MDLASIEEKVEDLFKAKLDNLKIKRYSKVESINPLIKEALRKAESKTGGIGGNFPDIQILLDNKSGRTIPVMMEVKGLKNKLEKLEKMVLFLQRKIMSTHMLSMEHITMV